MLNLAKIPLPCFNALGVCLTEVLNVAELYRIMYHIIAKAVFVNLSHVLLQNFQDIFQAITENDEFAFLAVLTSLTAGDGNVFNFTVTSDLHKRLAQH